VEVIRGWVCGTTVTGNRKEIPFRHTFYIKEPNSLYFVWDISSFLVRSTNLSR